MTTKPTEAQEREAFEAWATGRGFTVARDDSLGNEGRYMATWTTGAWSSWQARAALAATPAPVAAQPQGKREALVDLLRNADKHVGQPDLINILFKLINEAADMLAADAQQVAVPHGWKLVPVTITEDMHRAAVCMLTHCNGNDDFPPRVYKAMLSEAPQPPQAPIVQPPAGACFACEGFPSEQNNPCGLCGRTAEEYSDVEAAHDIKGDGGDK